MHDQYTGVADLFVPGDDEAEERWEEQLEQYDLAARLLHGDQAVPPSDRQLYAMRVSWHETERLMRLRKSTKKQWDMQNPPTEGDDIMDAAKKAESPDIAAAGLPVGVAESVVDPRLMPEPEVMQAWAEQNTPVLDVNYLPSEEYATLVEGQSIYEVPSHERLLQEEHGLGRFKQGMPTPQRVRDRSVAEHVRTDATARPETVFEHLARIGVTYKIKTSTKTGRTWVSFPIDRMREAEA